MRTAAVVPGAGEMRGGVVSDRFGRSVDTLRISVTDRCNLRCSYCMPAGGMRLIDRCDILSFEEIVALAGSFAGAGVSRIKLTGGEPLARKGVSVLVKALAETPGVEDLSLTTNGTLLAPLISSLEGAGLRRINISLDTLQKEKFRVITGSDMIDDVKRGMEAALGSGLFPVKLNVVLLKGVNDDEIPDFLKLAREKNIIVRFIEYMPTSGDYCAAGKDYFIPGSEVLKTAKKFFKIIPAGENLNGGPAKYFRILPGGSLFGLISPVSEPFCETCRRLRIDSRGELILCLHSGKSYSLRGLLREGDSGKLSGTIRDIVYGKPFSHLSTEPWNGSRTSMCRVGG